MSTYDPTAYGAAVADEYDECYDDDFYDSVGAVPFLVELAGAGPVLELGIGTGRLALPLRQAGLAVHGIDASEAMVARLRAKPGGDGITVTVADFSDFDLDDRLTLAVLAVNTLFALPSQDPRSAASGHRPPRPRRAIRRGSIRAEPGPVPRRREYPDQGHGQRSGRARRRPDRPGKSVDAHHPGSSPRRHHQPPSRQSPLCVAGRTRPNGPALLA